MIPASDYVKTLVSGYPKSLRQRRTLVVLQAVIDDSGRTHGPVFVLAGFVLGIEDWIAFSDAWQATLDGPPKIEYFKMKEAYNFTRQFKKFSTAQRDKRIQDLISLIMNYRPLAVRHVMPNKVYERVFKGRIAKAADYPYFLSYYSVIGTLFIYLHLQNPHRNDKVDFIFDLQSDREIELVRRVWNFAAQNMPSFAKSLVGNKPDHRDDKVFLPLQAADLLAWHVRRSYEEKSRGKEYGDQVWKALSTLKCAGDELTEDRLNKMMAGIKGSGLVFEYDLPPQMRRLVKRALRDKFKD